MTAEREAAEAIRRTELALQQAQKMETIGKLTGGVAHDFNNLLQVISGNLQLLSTDVGANPRALQRVNNALGGVRRGAKLASSLLAFGRRQALEPKVVKLSRHVAAMEDMLQPRPWAKRSRSRPASPTACGIPSPISRRWKTPCSTCASTRATRWTAPAS